ncbi:acyltransferase family protein [Rhizobium paknamense]|uniref:Peptidoglycan/LPS O-acetylase OafA/YrhL n=1 Tax=Rhizobium paknamense TaxID=1206817 RepID=A0ABU0IIM6_9HYPH|nr:acyltransferase family protein [Rhizobium paknamense]MDQ0458117.1 peptidoglycan/LPS O-acetylase OafA/YrhL [Rhizobium paknamense]
MSGFILPRLNSWCRTLFRLERDLHKDSYIPEIDVLRALAVVAVVLYHAGVPVLRGGFLGVDIFFVISGFLIARIYARSGVTYSALVFYRRRFLRIIPALVAVILLILPFVWLVSFDAIFSQYLRSGLYSLLFVANFDFWNHVDYFGPTNDEVPLLHVWSLSVEEQFYLVAPLILFCLRRFRSRSGVIAAVLILGSLILSLLLDRLAPDAGFFLMPARFWELAAGALIAFIAWRPRLTNGFAGALGVVLPVLMALLFAVYSEDRDLQTLGRLAAVVLAALYLLVFGEGGYRSPLAGFAPLRGLGKISYSLYLWHNPLLALISLQVFRSSSPQLVAGTVVLAVLLAIVSYVMIENPWRLVGRKVSAGQALVSSSIAALMILLMIGVPFYLASNGFRADERTRLVLEQAQTPVPKPYQSRCFLEAKSGILSFPDACKSAVTAQSTLVWGDSFARHLSYGLRTVRNDVQELSGAGCPPVIHVFFGGNPRCQGLNDQTLAEVIRAHPARLVLTAYWTRSEIYDASPGVEATVRRVREASPETRIILIGSPPIWRPKLPRLILRRNLDLNQDAVENTSLVEVEASDATLKAIAERNGARFISLKDMLCHGTLCRAWVDPLGHRALVTFDHGHFTYDGSLFVARQLSLDP